LLSVEEVGVGRLVKEAVLAVRRSHRGGNTHLGIALLLVPLAVAAGWRLGSGKNNRTLGFFARRVLAVATVEDSAGVFDAIRIARPGGLGKSRLDVRDVRSKGILRRLNMSLLKLMKYSSGRDMVARELASGMPVVFKFVVPNLKLNLEKTKNIKKAITQTYLQTLAKYPDTLIARKAGMKKAKTVSGMALAVLKAGGVYTALGRGNMMEFDRQLRSDGNKLNPGTTADLIAAGLFIRLLEKGV
jgi:triphosphoribosyl-dephospho-CoA synthase